MSAMQIGCTQKMSQVDQNPVWTADSELSLVNLHG